MSEQASRSARMSLAIVADARSFERGMAKAGEQFREFLRQVLANPIARAAFERAQKQPPPIMGGHGPAYRARARRRTRSNR